MAAGSRICPHCGRLNAAEDTTCFNCGKSLPGPVGRTAAGAARSFSADGLPATKLLLAMCVAVYALALVLEGKFQLFGGFRSSTLVRFGALFLDFGEREPYRLITAVFMHASLLHIGLNMLSHVNLGRTLEPHLGSARFFLLFVLCGVVGFWASQRWYGDSSPLTVGASGAIFGLVGARSAILLARRDSRFRTLLLNDVITLVVLAFVFPVNNAAHFGGAVTGFALGFAMEKEPQPRRRDRLFLALSGVALLACLAAEVASVRAPVWKVIRQQEQERE